MLITDINTTEKIVVVSCIITYANFTIMNITMLLQFLWPSSLQQFQWEIPSLALLRIVHMCDFHLIILLSDREKKNRHLLEAW